VVASTAPQPEFSTFEGGAVVSQRRDSDQCALSLREVTTEASCYVPGAASAAGVRPARKHERQ